MCALLLTQLRGWRGSPPPPPLPPPSRESGLVVVESNRRAQQLFSDFSNVARAMSPASSGTLQVERYIGACLISSRKSHQQQQQQQQQQKLYPADLYGNYGRWAGGMPLITFASKEENLVRLAGAPLIQAHRYRKKKKNDNEIKKGGASVAKSDAVSVTSDESANAENCLPRIIKPRKRRKKDRKPPPQKQDGFSTDSASPEACYNTPFAFEFRVPNESYHDALFEAPKLHHSFEEVEEARDVNGNQSTCQCRYCDPSGLIWDVDRNCYSPFLTTPSQNNNPIATKTKKFCLIHSFSSVSLDEDGSTKSDLEVSTEIVTSPNGHRDLEIKFFSQTTNRQFTDCLKSVEGCQCNEGV